MFGIVLATIFQLAFMTIGAASVASLIVRVFQIELFGNALHAIQLYWNLADWLAVGLFDWWFRDWFGIQLPRPFLDVLGFWSAAGGMAVRGERQHYRSMEKIHAYRMSDDKLVWWIKRYTLAAIMGPMSVFYRLRMALFQAYRWIKNAMNKGDQRSRELAWVYTRGSLEILAALFGAALLDVLFFWINRFEGMQSL